MAKNAPSFRKSFEFRKLLGRISDGLGVDNLRALKNLCYDFIPERKREEIDSGIALFNVLIEQSECLWGRNIINATVIIYDPSCCVWLLHKRKDWTGIYISHQLWTPPHTHTHTPC